MADGILTEEEIKIIREISLTAEIIKKEPE